MAHVEATLLSEVQTVEAGHSFRVGVRLALAPGWHVYWRNPGEAGLASEVTFEGSGLAFGPLQWPAPATLLSPDGSIVTYGYSQEVVLAAQGAGGRDTRAHRATLGAGGRPRLRTGVHSGEAFAVARARGWGQGRAGRRGGRPPRRRRRKRASVSKRKPD